MDPGSGETVPGGLRLESTVAEAIRRFFRDDRSRMTMMAARRFQVSEQTVLEVLIGDWPIVRLRDGIFRELMELLPTLGPLRVFVRSRAAIVEVVGTFGGFSESGPFLNVQTDTLDMHILHDEIAVAYAVEKAGHDATGETHSFQFFDHTGDAAFKVFLWDNFPSVPPERIAAFHALAARFAAPAGAAFAGGSATLPAHGVERLSRPIQPGRRVRPVPSAARRSGPDTEPAPAEPTDTPTGSEAASPAPAPDGKAATSPGFRMERLFEGAPPSARAKAEAVLPSPVRTFRRSLRIGIILAVLAMFGLLIHAFVVPLFWVHYEHLPRMSGAPKFTETPSGNAKSDPLNIGLIGAKADLFQSLLSAGWYPADAKTFAHGTNYVSEAVRKEIHYPTDRVASQYLGDTMQDLLFERPGVTGKMGRRFLRLWEAREFGIGGLPLWIGTVSTDRPLAKGAKSSNLVGVHITPEIDAARDGLIDDLSMHRWLSEVFEVTGVGPTFWGRNANGDPYFTDGEVTIGQITSGRPQDRPPTPLPSPWLVRVKDTFWGELGPIIAGSGD
jgi:putative hemin transport protein